ncbi:hypothetical protein FD733_05480 [Pantoea sp. Eser]|nr:hypothetical protein [Pantoea sp. Eser]
MDLFPLFIREQLYRLQVVRPTFWLPGIIHPGTGEDKGDLLALALHLKFYAQRRPELAGTLISFSIVFS